MEYTDEEIKDMIKCVPNGIIITKDDLKEIFKQDEL
jgi:hypothetical protein